jgi:hypothetical protein
MDRTVPGRRDTAKAREEIRLLLRLAKRYGRPGKVYAKSGNVEWVLPPAPPSDAALVRRARAGGYARAAALSPKARKASAEGAATARWGDKPALTKDGQVPCDVCRKPATNTCGCRRCFSEPEEEEKFHTCATHRHKVRENHRRIRGTEATF